MSAEPLNPNLHIGPITCHIQAIERWPEGAFQYATDQHNPWHTAACRGCGSRCDRRRMRCRECWRAATMRPYCPRGHEPNWHIKTNGTRICRTCDNERNRERRRLARQPKGVQ